MKKSRLVLAALLMTAATGAYAGEVIKGWGSTRSEAASDAENRARARAQAKGTCYAQAEYDRCQKDSEGGWVCIATVANHDRNNPGGLCP